MSDPSKLTEAAAAAIAAERLTGAPAELLLAQWVLESGSGKHSPGNNCFGIKEYSGCFGRQLLKTTEWFTDAELKHFLARGAGRTAIADPSSTFVTADGKRKYIVQDWFSTFPTLAACFEKRAQLFTAGRYKQFGQAYLQDRDLAKLIKGIASVYATSQDYGTTLLKIIAQQNVTVALAAGRGSGIQPA